MEHSVDNHDKPYLWRTAAGYQENFRNLVQLSRPPQAKGLERRRPPGGAQVDGQSWHRAARRTEMDAEDRGLRPRDAGATPATLVMVGRDPPNHATDRTTRAYRLFATYELCCQACIEHSRLSRLRRILCPGSGLGCLLVRFLGRTSGFGRYLLVGSRMSVCSMALAHCWALGLVESSPRVLALAT